MNTKSPTPSQLLRKLDVDQSLEAFSHIPN
jgi:hypothetical protein